MRFYKHDIRPVLRRHLKPEEPFEERHPIWFTVACLVGGSLLGWGMCLLPLLRETGVK